jgi:hypothetical protein
MYLPLHKWILFFLLISLYSHSFSQQQIGKNLLATLNRQHPRLLVQSLQDFEDLKKRASSNAYLDQCRKNILYEADTLLTTPTCRYEIPDGLRLLEISRRVLNRCYVLSMAFRLSGQKKYADRLWAELLAASQFPDWNPRHFLDVAEMTHAFAIGYDWLYDIWTPQQRQVIKQAITEKGLLRGLMFYQQLVPDGATAVDFPRTHSNWNSVCNSGMGIGAIAIADEEEMLAEKILQGAIQSIPLALEAYAPDGGFPEGPTYWGYAMKYNTVFIASLQSALGKDFGLSRTDGLDATGNFPIAMSGATGLPYQYADAWPEIVNSPVFFWLAKQYNNPLYAAYIQPISHPAVLEMLWYNQSAGVIDLPLDNYFKKVNVASFRSAWHDTTAWFVGIKGGSNQAPHSHLDLGSFILEKSGIRWLIDPGVDNYNLPGYFDKSRQRWTYYRVRAEGHNTLVINPDSLPDQNIFAAAPIQQFVSGKDKSFALIDLSEAYKGKVASAQRGIALLHKNSVVVQDELQSEQPIELYWFAHTPATITLQDGRKKALLQMGGKKLIAEIISPANAAFEIMQPVLLPTSVSSTGNNPNQGIRKLVIHLKGIRKTTLTVILYDESNAHKITLLPLEKW